MKYADPGYQADHKPRYDITTKKKVKAAWSYINHKDNAKRYSARERQLIHQRIQSAGHRYGIDFGHSRSKGDTMLGRTSDRTARRKGDR
ncbi:MAG: DUF6582 domain-containing protein [Ktedonobacterales bacterium]